AFLGEGPMSQSLMAYLSAFLSRAGHHVVFVGGGRISAQAQRRKIDHSIRPLIEQGLPRSDVTLNPKKLNMVQAYRFLGLGRVDWMTEEQKIEYLMYALDRIPPLFLTLMNVRLHEYPEITTMEEAKALVESEVDPAYWSRMLGLVGDLN
ncbi:MAG: hypothetical protein Q7S00_06640, partial [bacterium]|nr:hypothetical protein [bacterium]